VETKGFFEALFDVSFTSFVTTRIIKVIYIVTLVLIALGALVFVIAAFAQSIAGGLFVLIIVAPLAGLLYVIYARVLLEIVIAIFRIMENTAEGASLLRAQASGASVPPPTVPPAPPTQSPPPPPAPPAA
jgi:uncharacterized membrane protein